MEKLYGIMISTAIKSLKAYLKPIILNHHLKIFFLGLIKDYHPDNLYNENSSKAGNSFLVLVLKPKDEKKKISGVKEIKLYLDSKTYDIQSIYSTVKNKTQGWTINKIITKRKISRFFIQIQSSEKC